MASDFNEIDIELSESRVNLDSGMPVESVDFFDHSENVNIDDRAIIDASQKNMTDEGNHAENAEHKNGSNSDFQECQTTDKDRVDPKSPCDDNTDENKNIVKDNTSKKARRPAKIDPPSEFETTINNEILPKFALHRPASSFLYQTPHPDAMRKASNYRLSSSAGGKLHLGKKILRKRRLKSATPGLEDDEINRCSTVNTMVSAQTLEDSRPDSAVFEDGLDITREEDGINSFRSNMESDYRNQANYIRICHKLKTAPSSMVLRKLNEGTLCLTHHNLGLPGIKALSMALLNNVSVTSLDLTGNDLGLEGSRYISDLMSENNYITELRLGENNLKSDGLKLVTTFVKEHPFLQILDLSGNGFEEKDALPIAEIIEENRTLTELYLGHNSFRERGGEILAPALAKNDYLEVLDLKWNHLRRKGAIAICDGLKQNTTLLKINLAWNGFHMDGSKAFAQVLEENTTLQEVDLTSNRIDMTCLDFLLKGLKHNKSMLCIKLGSNPISSEGTIKILETIQQCGTSLPLNQLDLTGQSVQQKFIEMVDGIKAIKPFKVHHGLILEEKGFFGTGSNESFVHEDPMMILMEFMRIQNLRLVDLFTSLDKDGSKSLTRKEFRDGLLGVNIPMSPKMLNNLIDKLDADGDGEVDFRELLEGQKEHRRKLHLIQQRNKKDEVPWENTEIGRINVKIKALMALKAAAATAKRERDATFAKQKESALTTVAVRKIRSAKSGGK